MPEIPPLPDPTILLVEVGSTAHGTGIPGGEDHDEMGIVVEGPLDVLGLAETGWRARMHRTQPEGVRSGAGDTDRTLYSLRKFLRLAASGNPSVLLALWAPVLHATEDGLALRSLSGAFIGRHMIGRYRGYMNAQAQRLLGLRGGRRSAPTGNFGYDTKYAMHCARLGFQCLELLTKGNLTLPVQGEPAQWLRAVRRGEVSFDEWWQRSLSLDAQLLALGADESIPPHPDRAVIEQWSVATHLKSWTT
jgi:predicted nucleotidyltransferase